MSTEEEPLLNIKSTCHGCGLTVTHTGDDGVRIMRQIDAAHDALRPDCPEAVKRAAEVSS